jgi:hypothetical protein
MEGMGLASGGSQIPTSIFSSGSNDSGKYEYLPMQSFMSIT